MLRKFASVSGFTLLSRFTGFLRDIVIASMLGSGMAADAYFVAQRLPNHFRAIFGEGAFNSAFVPAYASEISQAGEEAARHFAGRILTLLTLILIPLCLAALWHMPFVIDILAPGFENEPEKYALAITLTRITFPYLLMISLVTLLSGVLNAHNRFASAAGAPVLLNLAIIAALGLAFLFPSAAHAAAWGIAISGVLQLALLGFDARRHGLLPRFEKPSLDPAMQRFFKALGPAVIGSAGVQIAIFADTIIASLLPTGAVSAISYADRLYQLPIGLIGIAAGTVLLPEMSRHLAAGAPEKAHAAQNRSIGLTLALSAPFLIAFLMIPNEIVRGVFVRGQFTVEDGHAAALVLQAYAIGLLPIVLIRSLVSGFYAKHDTATPLMASFLGIGVNLVLKLTLYQSHGASGLALATAIGAWVNALLLAVLSLQKHLMMPDAALYRKMAAICIAALILATATPWLLEPTHRMTETLGTFAAASALLTLAAGGALLYGATLFIGLKGLRVRL
jgi:putative peptidoglycan lipid II flippase